VVINSKVKVPHLRTKRLLLQIPTGLMENTNTCTFFEYFLIDKLQSKHTIHYSRDKRALKAGAIILDAGALSGNTNVSLFYCETNVK
jgi:hypothetical protein